MTRLASVAPLLALLAHAPAQARTHAGVELPDTVVVDGTTLRLNGVGLREATRLRIMRRCPLTARSGAEAHHIPPAGGILDRYFESGRRLASMRSPTFKP